MTDQQNHQETKHTKNQSNVGAEQKEAASNADKVVKSQTILAAQPKHMQEGGGWGADYLSSGD